MVHIYAVACNLNWLGMDIEQAAQDRKNKNIRASLEDRIIIITDTLIDLNTTQRRISIADNGCTGHSPHGSYSMDV